jgi:hypothetical protein
MKSCPNWRGGFYARTSSDAMGATDARPGNRLQPFQCPARSGTIYANSFIVSTSLILTTDPE